MAVTRPAPPLFKVIFKVRIRARRLDDRRKAINQGKQDPELR